MAVYGYARVSTLRQANEGESLDVQRRQIEGYCLMHGMALNDILIEEGVSGSIPINERPAGGALVHHVEPRRVLPRHAAWHHRRVARVRLDSRARGGRAASR